MKLNPSRAAFLLFHVFMGGSFVGCATVPQRQAAAYSLQCGGETVSFALPARWQSTPASRTNAVTFIPSDVSDAPALEVTVTPRRSPLRGSDDRAAQERLARKYLADLRRTNWPDAGMLLEEVLIMPDGRNILQWLELSNVRHLVSFVSLGSCVVEINMWGEATLDSRARRDFSDLVRSLKTE